MIQPRLLSRDEAATYCGVSVPTFVAECPVIPLKIRNRVLYDRKAIDLWLDSKLPAQPTLGETDWAGRLDGGHAN